MGGWATSFGCASADCWIGTDSSLVARGELRHGSLIVCAHIASLPVRKYLLCSNRPSIEREASSAIRPCERRTTKARLMVSLPKPSEAPSERTDAVAESPSAEATAIWCSASRTTQGVGPTMRRTSGAAGPRMTCRRITGTPTGRPSNGPRKPLTKQSNSLGAQSNALGPSASTLSVARRPLDNSYSESVAGGSKPGPSAAMARKSVSKPADYSVEPKRR